MVATDQKTQHNKKISPILISIFIRNLPEPIHSKLFIIGQKSKGSRTNQTILKKKCRKNYPHDDTRQEGMVPRKEKNTAIIESNR